MTAVRVTQAPVEVLYASTSPVRVTQAPIELLHVYSAAPTLAETVPPNAVRSALAAALGTGTTVMQIAGADAAKFPSANTARYRCLLYQDANTGPFEIVTVTSGQGGAVLGITRASESYNGDQTARSWPSGTNVVAVLTYGAMTALYGAGVLGSPIKGPEVVLLTAAQATIRLPVSGSLVQTYRHLRLKWQCRADTAGAQTFRIQFNGDTAAKYDWSDRKSVV